MWPLINVSKNQVFTLLSVVSQAGLSGSFSGSCQAARPCMIFSALVTLVLVSHPAKLRQDTSQTLARLSNTERDIFLSGSCLADVCLRERYSRQSQAGFRLCLVQKFRTGINDSMCSM